MSPSKLGDHLVLPSAVTAFEPCRAFNGRLANADNKINYSGYRSPPDIIQAPA
jgi:hypothetical protein